MYVVCMNVMLLQHFVGKIDLCLEKIPSHLMYYIGPRPLHTSFLIEALFSLFYLGSWLYSSSSSCGL